jgi:hypothetical protein
MRDALAVTATRKSVGDAIDENRFDDDEQALAEKAGINWRAIAHAWAATRKTM